MGKYAEDAKELLELVGGRQNIAAVSHCMTRMRFVLSDPSIADVKKIEAMKTVKGASPSPASSRSLSGIQWQIFIMISWQPRGLKGYQRTL